MMRFSQKPIDQLALLRTLLAEDPKLVNSVDVVRNNLSSAESDA